MDFANAYRKIGAETAVTEADPHRLIELLLQGALDRVATAKGFMLRGEVAPKGAAISDAINMLDGLRMGLDKTRGGEIAQNLEDLYEYVQRRLLDANRSNDPRLLEEAAALLGQIKSGWSAIADQVKAPQGAR